MVGWVTLKVTQFRIPDSGFRIPFLVMQPRHTHCL